MAQKSSVDKPGDVGEGLVETWTSDSGQAGFHTQESQKGLETEVLKWTLNGVFGCLVK